MQARIASPPAMATLRDGAMHVKIGLRDAPLLGVSVGAPCPCRAVLAFDAFHNACPIGPRCVAHHASRGAVLHTAPPPSAPSPLRNALRPQYRYDATDRISISPPGSQSHFSVSIRNERHITRANTNTLGWCRRREARERRAVGHGGVARTRCGPRGACTYVLRRLPLARAPEGGRDTAPRRVSSCQPRERIPPRQRRPTFRQHLCPARDASVRERSLLVSRPPSSHHPPARIHQIGLHLPETVPPSSSLRPDRTTNSPARDADWSVWRFTAIGPIFFFFFF